MKQSAVKRVTLGAAGALLAASVPLSAQAVSLVNAWVLADWALPDTATSPPVAVTDITSYKLTIDGSGVATGFEVDNLGDLSAIEALTYSSHTGTINPGETDGTTAARVSSEVGKWDDAAIVTEGPDDAALNLDYSSGSGPVIFNRPPSNGKSLIIAEDAGLDGFKLSLCGNATCSPSSKTTVFDGFNSTVGSGLVNKGLFSFRDTSNPDNMDQAFYFAFDEALSGYWISIETSVNGCNATNCGEPLEIDFAGVVPIPAAAWLFGSALLGVAAIGYRRTATA